ncbi:MAG: extracellular solute-binding protein [Lachnospiraceae bacterium]|nr:extracellular solute-binding protein [Lachnospiraceae bacterium]
MKKTFVAGCLAVAVAGSVAGCGNSSAPSANSAVNNTAGAESGVSSPAETGSSAEASAENGAVTLSFFDKNSGTRTFDDPVAKELEKRTGVKINLVSPTGDPAEKLSLMLAAQDYPDIVLMDRGSDIVNQYIEAGALVNLSDYMDMMPNVKAMYGDTLDKSVYTDGNNYYLNNWYGYDPDPCNGFIARYDTMVELVGKDRADSDEPFTFSEWLKLLKQYKEKHPEVEGQRSIAVEMMQPVSFAINGMFAGANGMKTLYIDNQGNAHFQFEDPKFLDTMHQMNELYTEGLLDPEWTSNSTDLRNQKLSNPNVFGYCGTYWDTWAGSQALAAAGYGKDAEYLAYKVVADDIDPSKNTLDGRNSLGWDAIAITNNCQNIEAACKFLDYVASQEGQDLLLWGIEGDSWEYVNGVRTPKGDIVERYQQDSTNTVIDTGICKWTWCVKNANHDDDGTASRIFWNEKNRSTQQAYKNLTDGYYDTAYFSNLEPSGSTVEALEYQKIVDIFNADYPNMVNAASQEECDSQYQKMISDMKDAGLDDVTAYVNDSYHARMKLWGEE